jgi:hypothetical protein
LLLLDGQVHHDTHPIPMGNYVIEVGNYVSANPSDLGNYVSADNYIVLKGFQVMVQHRIELMDAYEGFHLFHDLCPLAL